MCTADREERVVCDREVVLDVAHAHRLHVDDAIVAHDGQHRAGDVLAAHLLVDDAPNFGDRCGIESGLRRRCAAPEEERKSEEDSGGASAVVRIAGGERVIVLTYEPRSNILYEDDAYSSFFRHSHTAGRRARHRAQPAGHRRHAFPDRLVHESIHLDGDRPQRRPRTALARRSARASSCRISSLPMLKPTRR